MGKIKGLVTELGHVGAEKYLAELRRKLKEKKESKNGHKSR
jgi:hypothetical protein